MAFILHGCNNEIGVVYMSIKGRGPATLFIMWHQHGCAKLPECISGETGGGRPPPFTIAA